MWAVQSFTRVRDPTEEDIRWRTKTCCWRNLFWLGTPYYFLARLLCSFFMAFSALLSLVDSFPLSLLCVFSYVCFFLSLRAELHGRQRLGWTDKILKLTLAARKSIFWITKQTAWTIPRACSFLRFNPWYFVWALHSHPWTLVKLKLHLHRAKLKFKSILALI